MLSLDESTENAEFAIRLTGGLMLAVGVLAVSSVTAVKVLRRWRASVGVVLFEALRVTPHKAARPEGAENC